MKCLLSFFCILIFLVDLSIDACLGKVDSIAVPSPIQLCSPPPNKCDPGTVNPPVELAHRRALEVQCLCPIWLGGSVVTHALKIIEVSLMGSSGGIPL